MSIYKGNDDYFLMRDLEHRLPTRNRWDVRRCELSEVIGPTKLPVNTWTHFAATYDGATLRLYVNGVQVASKAQHRLDRDLDAAVADRRRLDLRPVLRGSDRRGAGVSGGVVAGGDSGGYGGAVGWAAGYDGAVAGVGVGGECGELESD